MIKDRPLDHPCSTCGARVDKECRDPRSGAWVMISHKPRLVLAWDESDRIAKKGWYA